MPQLFTPHSHLAALVLKSTSLVLGTAILTSSLISSTPVSATHTTTTTGSDTSQIPIPPPTTGTPTTTGTTTTTGTPTTTTSMSTRFTCQFVNGQYTVMYNPESQPNQSYAWATPSAMGGGWSPDRRCNEISRRLESYRPDGLLEMLTGVQNNYNVICVTTERVPGCRLVLTVPQGQDPTITRDRVFQNLTVADSGQQTQGINTFTGSGKDPVLGDLVNLGNAVLGGNNRGRSGNINLRPFLDRADGGTGAKLRSGGTTPVKNSPRLNPSKFR